MRPDTTAMQSTSDRIQLLYYIDLIIMIAFFLSVAALVSAAIVRGYSSKVSGLMLISVHVFSYKLRHIVGFGLVEMAISTNPKSAINRNLYENTGWDNCFYTGHSASTRKPTKCRHHPLASYLVCKHAGQPSSPSCGALVFEQSFVGSGETLSCLCNWIYSMHCRDGFSLQMIAVVQ